MENSLELQSHFQDSKNTYINFLEDESDEAETNVINTILLDIQLVLEWDFNVDLPVAKRLGDVPPTSLDRMVATFVEADVLYSKPSNMTSMLYDSFKPFDQHKKFNEALAPIGQLISKYENKENERSKSSVKVIGESSKAAEAVTKPVDKSRRCYTHISRDLSYGAKDQPCFVCRGICKGTLMKCEGKHGGKHGCPTRFHEACVKVYNAGDYDFTYLKEVTGKAVCPLHICSICFQERRKTSAIAGHIITCSKCYRGYHSICLPATCEIRKEKLEVPAVNNTFSNAIVEMTTCHAHVDLTPRELSRLKNFPVFTGAKGKRLHLPFCCECEAEGDKKTLVACTQCIRSFHPKCHGFDTVIRDGVAHEGQTLCEGCIYGDFVRAGQHCIARYQSTFYPCTAVALDDYPAHCKSADKYGSFLGRVGFVAVQWGGCHNLFSLLPSGTVTPMFCGSYNLIGKRMSDPDHARAWSEMDDDCDPPVPEGLRFNDNYTNIRSSLPFGECKNLKIPEVCMAADEATCSCEANESNRCGPGSDCQNRALSQECPKSCEALGGCGNRVITNRQVHPHIKKMKTKGKGYGVFATATIPMDTIIGEYAGELITVEEKNRRIEVSKRSRNNEEMHYMMGLDNQRTIDCKFKGNIARFLNHSCEPNCKVTIISVITGNRSIHKQTHFITDVRVAVQTLRDIQLGEELCFNYRMDKLADEVDLPICLCNTKSCSGKLSKKETDASKSKKESRVEEANKAEAKKKAVVTPKQVLRTSKNKSSVKAASEKKQQTKKRTPVIVKKEEGATQGRSRRRGRNLSTDNNTVLMPIHVTKGNVVGVPLQDARAKVDAIDQFFPSAKKAASPIPAVTPKVNIEEEEDLQLLSPETKKMRIAVEDELSDHSVKDEEDN